MEGFLGELGFFLEILAPKPLIWSHILKFWYENVVLVCQKSPLLSFPLLPFHPLSSTPTSNAPYTLTHAELEFSEGEGCFFFSAKDFRSVSETVCLFVCLCACPKTQFICKYVAIHSVVILICLTHEFLHMNSQIDWQEGFYL